MRAGIDFQPRAAGGPFFRGPPSIYSRPGVLLLGPARRLGSPAAGFRAICPRDDFPATRTILNEVGPGAESDTGVPAETYGREIASETGAAVFFAPL